MKTTSIAQLVERVRIRIPPYQRCKNGIGFLPLPHHKDQIHKREMAQRRAVRYTTNRFRNAMNQRIINDPPTSM